MNLSLYFKEVLDINFVTMTQMQHCSFKSYNSLFASWLNLKIVQFSSDETIN